MSWIIRAYSRDDEALVEEIEVDDALRAVFRALLDRPASDPMVDTFPLDGDALAALAGMLGLQTDPGRLEYFLDFDAT